VVGATPVRLSADPDLYVRDLIVEYDAQSTGTIVVSDSEMKATTRNVHSLFGPGDFISFDSAAYANLNAEIRPYDYWVHGDTIGDRVVVSYHEITGDRE
jgi:hypothetical protein